MITVISLFLGCYYILATFLDAIVVEAEAFMALLGLLMLAFAALAIFAHQPRAWTPAIFCLLGMVATELLVPHIAMVEILTALVLAILATMRIKREINTFIARDARAPGGPTLSPHMVIFLRFIWFTALITRH